MSQLVTEDPAPTPLKSLPPALLFPWDTFCVAVLSIGSAKGLLLQKPSVWESSFIHLFQSNPIRSWMLSTACEQPSSTSESTRALGVHGLGPGASSPRFAS